MHKQQIIVVLIIIFINYRSTLFLCPLKKKHRAISFILEFIRVLPSAQYFCNTLDKNI